MFHCLNLQSRPAPRQSSLALLVVCFAMAARPCSAAGGAAPTARPMLAVMPLVARSVDSESVEGLTSALATELLNTGRIRVMERSQMARILAEQGFQQSGSCDGSECAVEMGRLLAVDRMVLGSISRVGSLYAMNVRLVDVGTGEILRSVTRNGPAKMELVLTELVPQVADELVADGTRRAHPDTKENASAAVAASSGRRSAWPWIFGGAALAGGGIAAYFLLAGGGSAAEDPPAQTGNIIHATW